MSGGSFNYLYRKDAFELLESYSVEADLQQMADCLAERGDADAAEETLEVLLEMRRARNRIQTRVERLREVWHAVEWWQSHDVGPKDVDEAIAKYRGESK